MVINSVPLCDKVTALCHTVILIEILLGLEGEGIHHGGIVSNVQII